MRWPLAHLLITCCSHSNQLRPLDPLRVARKDSLLAEGLFMLPEAESSSQGKSAEEEIKMEAGQQGPPAVALPAAGEKPSTGELRELCAISMTASTSSTFSQAHSCLPPGLKAGSRGRLSPTSLPLPRPHKCLLRQQVHLHLGHVPLPGPSSQPHMLLRRVHACRRDVWRDGQAPLAADHRPGDYACHSAWPLPKPAPLTHICKVLTPAPVDQSQRTLAWRSCRLQAPAPG